MKLNFLPRLDDDDRPIGTIWLFTPENEDDSRALDELASRFLPTIQACERCGAYDVQEDHWPCKRPKVKNPRAAWEKVANR